MTKEQKKIYNKKYLETHREQIKELKRKYRETHIEEIKEYDREKRTRPDYKAKKSKWAAADYERRKEHIKLKVKEWRLNNPLKLKTLRSVANAKRRAAELNANVSYANKDAIKRIYRTRDILNTFGETKYCVDHIIPLRGKLVCGLHHEDNLQIITSTHNLTKSNRFKPTTKDVI